jgi:hypothetical protein
MMIHTSTCHKYTTHSLDRKKSPTKSGHTPRRQQSCRAIKKVETKCGGCCISSVHPQNVRFQTSGFKTSGLHSVRLTKRQVSKRLVSKRPVFKFYILIKQKVFVFVILVITSHYGDILQKNLKNRK